MNAFSICFETPLPYAEVMKFQDALVSARISGAIPDIVLLLEHTPVITLGVRAREKHVLAPPDQLARQNIETVRTSRGGAATWHGPGQLVMYPVIKLGTGEKDARGYLQNLEEVAIRTAHDFGISAHRRQGLTGIWTATGKLASIGIRFKRWVAFHGISFNVSPELSGFELIIPCGLTGERATSLQQIMGENCPSVRSVRASMIEHFSHVCGRRLINLRDQAAVPENMFDVACPTLNAYDVIKTFNG